MRIRLGEGDSESAAEEAVLAIRNSIGYTDYIGASCRGGGNPGGSAGSK